MSNAINLQTNSILHIPFHKYEKDFTFIVNGKEYQTSRFVADILSPKISKLHNTDPTISEYYITTNHLGNFEQIIELGSFQNIEIENRNDEYFISEIFDLLGTDKAVIHVQECEITVDNAIQLLIQHTKSPIFYSAQIESEINKVSEHFSELSTQLISELMNLSYDIIIKIINNEKLQLENEDELLLFINELYERDAEYSPLYETVLFSNVSSESIEKFVRIFNIECMTKELWSSISLRLCEEMKSQQSNQQRNYRGKQRQGFGDKKINENWKEIPYSINNYEGIFNYLRKESNIREEVNVTSSSGLNSSTSTDLLLQIGEESRSNQFGTNNSINSWICFEFKKHKILPTNYTIRTFNGWINSWNPKTFVIEASNDNVEWKKIDEQINCNFLNEGKYIHTFSIKNLAKDEKFKYIRLRQIGSNCSGSNYLYICSIEFYGYLI